MTRKRKKQHRFCFHFFRGLIWRDQERKTAHVPYTKLEPWIVYGQNSKNKKRKKEWREDNEMRGKKTHEFIRSLCSDGFFRYSLGFSPFEVNRSVTITTMYYRCVSACIDSGKHRRIHISICMLCVYTHKDINDLYDFDLVNAQSKAIKFYARCIFWQLNEIDIEMNGQICLPP